ncbi:hypothetical protein T492DRAFT_831505 [Pavlovales sp. CCMP2436]|nr:hypothetical protein T492DRAFT_831505 [Pavlovales sp. CCMP2436]
MNIAADASRAINSLSPARELLQTKAGLPSPAVSASPAATPPSPGSAQTTVATQPPLATFSQSLAVSASPDVFSQSEGAFAQSPGKSLPGPAAPVSLGVLKGLAALASPVANKSPEVRPEGLADTQPSPAASTSPVAAEIPPAQIPGALLQIPTQPIAIWRSPPSAGAEASRYFSAPACEAEEVMPGGRPFPLRAEPTMRTLVALAELMPSFGDMLDSPGHATDASRAAADATAGEKTCSYFLRSNIVLCTESLRKSKHEEEYVKLGNK